MCNVHLFKYLNYIDFIDFIYYLLKENESVSTRRLNESDSLSTTSTTSIPTSNSPITRASPEIAIGNARNLMSFVFEKSKKSIIIYLFYVNI